MTGREVISLFKLVGNVVKQRKADCKSGAEGRQNTCREAIRSAIN